MFKYTPLTADEIQVLKAECVLKREALWLHHFAQAVELSTINKFNLKGIPNEPNPS